MPVYDYTALTAKGKKRSGIIDAESLSAARLKLKTSHIFPISIRETQASPDASHMHQVLGVFSKRIRTSELTMITRQLATLINAGFPLVSALDSLISQTRSRPLQTMLSQIKESIVAGSSFAAALGPYQDALSPLYVNMVRAGESSGTLEIVLDRLAEIMEKQHALQSRIRSALAYPILMTAVGAMVLFFLVIYIVPSITTIFEDMNRVLPTPTRFLIFSAAVLKSYGWLTVPLLISILLGVRQTKKNANGRLAIDTLLLRLPGIGKLMIKLATARFCRTLGSLLANGVTMMAALDIVKNIVGNARLAQTVDQATQLVSKGQALAPSLDGNKIFPSLAIQMIQVGEQSGELENMLSKIADVYEQEVTATIMSLMALLEPAIILIMGVVVGFIVLSICLPIFEMNQLVM